MVRAALFLVLSAGTLLAQTPRSNASSALQTSPSNSTNQSNAPATADSAPDVGPDQAVIRIPGVCSASVTEAEAKSPCTTEVTREEFERLVKALQANGQPLPAKARQNVAEVYADLLTFEQAAKKAGIEKDTEYQQFLRWQYLRELAGLYRRDLERKYRNPDARDIHAYYLNDPPRFTEMKLRRILIPRKNPLAQNQGAYEKSALESANQARQRAAQGEELDKIQKEIYGRLAISAPPPAIDIGMKRKAAMSSETGNEVFSLRPGEVSKVELSEFSFTIYKVESKRLLPEAEVKDEIARAIVAERIENAIRSVKASARPEFNPRYFQAITPTVPPPATSTR